MLKPQNKDLIKNKETNPDQSTSLTSSYDSGFLDTIHPIRNNLINMSSDVELWMKEHPVTSAGIALSAGVLIGRLSAGRPTRS